MTRRLFLCGPIGCGKSTLIKNALGDSAKKSGGFVTIRVTEAGELRGFDLLPSCSLACPERKCEARRFLSFNKHGVARDESVFTSDAVELLTKAKDAPFALLDELGGFELALPEFFAALTDLLKSPVPCIGVIKSPAAASSLKERVGVSQGWDAARETLLDILNLDNDTTVLYTTGRYDEAVKRACAEWVREYVESI